MTNFKASIFDLIAFIIPGIVVILAFTIAINKGIKGVNDLLLLFKNIDLTTSFILIGLSYVIGFSTYGIGSFVYRKVNKFFWKDSYYEIKERKSAFKWATVREYSPANFVAINRWAALKGMAQNLTIGLIILALSIITKFRSNEYLIEWIIISISCLIMGVLLLNRARTYKRYREQDFEATMEMLKEKNINKEEKKTP